MSWLLREGEVLAAVEEPGRGWARMPSSDIHGVIVVGARNVVHTFGCPTAFDVAWCAETVGEDDEQMLEVRRTARLGARRVALPHLVRGVTVVAPCGSFERWRLHVGDRLEIT